MDTYLSLIITLVLFVPDGFAKVYDNSRRGYKTAVPSMPPNATDINLSRNRFRFIGAYAFSNYTSLEKLNLEYNEITIIDATAFSSTVISTLKLARNKLIEFPDLTAISGTLTDLRIGDNEITTINATVLSLTVIRTLSLTGNKLIEFPDLRTLSDTLTELTISYNEITTINATVFFINSHPYPKSDWKQNN